MTRPIRLTIVGLPTKYHPEQPPEYPDCVRVHCTCGTEIWMNTGYEVNPPDGCYVVERSLICVVCMTPAEFIESAANTLQLGYRHVS